jgi:sulfur relay protein TusB/DsrH
LLVSKSVHSKDAYDKVFGLAMAARDRGFEIAVYLIGDGVLTAKKDSKVFDDNNFGSVLDSGITIAACKQDLLARALPPEHVQPGIVILDDLEGTFLEDMMENADRVVAW